MPLQLLLSFTVLLTAPVLLSMYVTVGYRSVKPLCQSKAGEALSKAASSKFVKPSVVPPDCSTLAVGLMLIEAQCNACDSSVLCCQPFVAGKLDSTPQKRHIHCIVLQQT